jgi:KDO2-lipid IV(A) lauroyltransferase
VDIGDRAPFYLYRAAARVARTLPAPVAEISARAMGLPLAGMMRGRREMVSRHIRRVRPELRGVALRRAVQECFDSYARYWVEAFRLPDLSPAQITADMDATGLEHLRAATDAGAGVIVVMPHLGGWDFGGAFVAAQGFPVTVVVERLEPPELFDWFVRFRRSLGVTVVPLGPEAGSATLRALRRNEVVGLIADRDIGGRGVEVEFFGETTKLPGGPATLALRTGAPIVPAAVYYNRPAARLAGQPGHRGVIHPPLPIERKGRLRDDVVRVTQQIAHALEDLIRVAPEQWHLFQPNWPSDHDILERTRRSAAPGRS